MIYGKFVEELPQWLRHHIVAYEALPQYKGCVLHLRQGLLRVELEPGAIAHDRGELLEVLRGLVEQGCAQGRHVRISQQGGRLVKILL